MESTFGNYSDLSDSDPDPDIDSNAPNNRLMTIFKTYQSSNNQHVNSIQTKEKNLAS